MAGIYTAIRNDHHAHRDLLETISDTTGASDTRQRAWDEFYRDVKAHAAAEEETFYSKLISKTWGQEQARHSVTEHKELDDMMEELNGMDMSSPGWLQKFKTLQHDYLHHIEEEENEVFERAREVIDEDEVEGFGKRFHERKREERDLIQAKLEDALED